MNHCYHSTKFHRAQSAYCTNLHFLLSRMDGDWCRKTPPHPASVRTGHPLPKGEGLSGGVNTAHTVFRTTPVGATKPPGRAYSPTGGFNLLCFWEQVSNGRFCRILLGPLFAFAFAGADHGAVEADLDNKMLVVIRAGFTDEAV